MLAIKGSPGFVSCKAQRIAHESPSLADLGAEQLERLARVVVDACPRQRRGNGPQNAPDARQRAFDRAAGVAEPSKSVGFPDALAMLPDEDRYDVEERAAIMEFDGGLDRNEAERAAISIYWRDRHAEN